MESGKGVSRLSSFVSRVSRTLQAGCHSSCNKHIVAHEKSALPRAPDNYARPLHVVTPWPVPWLTWRSAELTHATRVASHRGRAQSARHSPPGADDDWSTRLALLFAASQSSMALPTSLHHAGCTLHPACQLLLGKPVACWVHAKPHAHQWNSMRRAATLCKPVMGVARADGLYGHG